MGARGLFGVHAGGKLKVHYVQWSYPTDKGVKLLRFLNEQLNKDGGAAVQTLAERLIVVDDDTPPTKAQQRKLAQYVDRGVGSGKLDEWYVLLRTTQGDLQKILLSGYVEDAKDNGGGLDMEYGYVVDFDASAVEFYVGEKRGAKTKGRFKVAAEVDGNGLHLVKTIPFAAVKAAETDDAALLKLFGPKAKV